MQQEPPKPITPRFAEICQHHHPDYPAMQAIADVAGVTRGCQKQKEVFR